MSIPALCNEGCNKQFTVDGFDIEQLNDGVEKTYFECPHCKHRYVAYYTDPEIRKVQSIIRNLGQNNQTTRGIEIILRNTRLMDQLRKRMEDEHGT
ncbi:hypothetical protein [Paenibacillus illinoisensis]|uniref:hypothetical protein n=1 Tax=Paenibacillus illinoisensis TaxID=59845 RepID=UPI00301B9673